LDVVAAFDYLNDLAGNLTYRADMGLIPNVKERFCYDPLNRLTQSALAVGSDPGPNCAALGGTVNTVAYDALGNITAKTGVGTYTYGGASGGPHAVSSITGTVNGVVNPAYAYDLNGNMLSGAGRAVTYTAFNMVATITQGASTYSWTYDDQHRRIHGQSRFYINDPGTGALSEMVGGKQNKTWYDYVQAEGRIVAELPRVTPSGSAPGPFYFVTDSLGSIAAQLLPNPRCSSRVGSVSSKIQALIRLIPARGPNGSEASGAPTSSDPRSMGKAPVRSMSLRTSSLAPASSPE
jgi:hypothetical protein